MGRRWIFALIAAVTLSWPVAGSATGEVRSPGQGRLPRYVLDFYRQLAEEDVESRKTGTAVHALLPSKGVVEDAAAQLFNLTGIHGQQVLQHAELHLHRRLLPGRRGRRAGSLRIRVCHTTSERVAILEDIVLNLNSSGWQQFDVTAAVRVALTSAKHLLGLRIELKRPGRFHFRPVRRRHMRRWRLQPFIVIFTDDGFSMEEDIAHNYLRVPKLSPEAPPSGDIRRAELLPSSVGHGSSSSRLRRSVEDNRLSSYSEGGYYRYEVEGSEDEQHAAVFRHYEDEMAVTQPSTTTALADSSLIPYPTNQKRRKWRRRKHKRKRRKHRRRKLSRSRQLPVKWNTTRINTPDRASSPQRPPPPPSAPPPSAPPHSSCGLRRLTVDFVALGWGEWIISPQRFDAFYCAGQCAFPLNRESRPTNHATIQSLASRLGLPADGTGRGSHVPAPCCVPDHMESLTLLYFDETRQNVVLKNYPNMVVKSCSCR